MTQLSQRTLYRPLRGSQDSSTKHSRFLLGQLPRIPAARLQHAPCCFGELRPELLRATSHPSELNRSGADGSPATGGTFVRFHGTTRNALAETNVLLFADAYRD